MDPFAPLPPLPPHRPVADWLRRVRATLSDAVGASGDRAARSQARGVLAVVATLLLAGGLLIAGIVRTTSNEDLAFQTLSATRETTDTTTAPTTTTTRPTTTTSRPTTSTTRPTTTTSTAPPRTTMPPAAAGGSTGLLVIDVIDGDTIDVEGGIRVRLIGIDTPERGECGFESASSALASMISGRRVALIPGARDNADRYGRLLRYVELNGADAGYSLLSSGLAIARYDSLDGYGWHPRESLYRSTDATVPASGGCPDRSSSASPTPVGPVPLFGGGGDTNLPAAPVPGNGGGGGGAYYANCSAAWAAGAAPLYASSPGYRSGLDRDKDGVACESRP